LEDYAINDFFFAVSLLLANVEPNKPTESVDPKILGKWEL